MCIRHSKVSCLFSVLTSSMSLCRVFIYHDCVMCSGVHSTGELPPGMVLGLTVDDPRLTLPSKNVKALTCVKQAQGKTWPTRRRGARWLDKRLKWTPHWTYWSWGIRQFCILSRKLADPTEGVAEGSRLVLSSGGPLPGHADVPGSNPGRTLHPSDTLGDWHQPTIKTATVTP